MQSGLSPHFSCERPRQAFTLVKVMDALPKSEGETHASLPRLAPQWHPSMVTPPPHGLSTPSSPCPPLLPYCHSSSLTHEGQGRRQTTEHPSSRHDMVCRLPEDGHDAHPSAVTATRHDPAQAWDSFCLSTKLTRCHQSWDLNGPKCNSSPTPSQP